MESDLKTLSHRNLFCKYADDTNLSVPDKSDFGLNEEFIKIENWARMNKLSADYQSRQDKRDCFQATQSKTFLPTFRLSIILKRLMVVNLLGVLLPINFCFDAQVGNVLKISGSIC